ncbi:uncharacterized protein E0L32_000092 [Thyridium curvatum]|uniref:Uncharacterized protein n=1 Tax=Thyridium curvatum TaxID=1093900 RepID=A0A507BGC7_9PEZI|nr:uncharacterized protein E0L32_000092 [Thyridium curvatum]TPX15758.1 hypothetical protein E0L32_000092 [Thyridium curvatum]
MASPLTPAHHSTLNCATPATSRRYDDYEVRAYTTYSDMADGGNDEGDSSPFVSTVQDDNQENIVPAKVRPASRIMSGTELSPLKILQDRAPSAGDLSVPGSATLPPARSPRKFIPEKRFPVKVSLDETPRAPRQQPSTPQSPAPQQQEQQHPSPRAAQAEERTANLEEIIHENPGLKHAIDILEDDSEVLDNDDHAGSDDSVIHHAADEVVDEDDAAAGIDDTMVSTFSTFSALPNLTMFAKLGQSPTKFGDGLTPRAPRGPPSPSRTPRAGPLPNRTAHYESTGNTTSLLMDFTEQLRVAQRNQSPPRNGRVSPSKSAPGQVPQTPQRSNLVNLLDFDIPPLPTPRSIPTITPRELESLKSNFLSEISSLKASLSGKEAEVQSLKTAVGDAEKRVGQSMEQLREERSLREALGEEKDSWEKRGRDMENVLRKVKEEIVIGSREREELEAKLTEAEQRREAAEMMAQEAESKMAGMRAGKASAEAAASPDRVRSPGGGGGGGASSTQREVEVAVERVARELHAAYKTKHETKVAALKKSYESRWEKRVRELEARIVEASEENEKLRLGRDATMTRVAVPSAAEAEAEEERKARAARDSAQIKQLEAEVEKLEAVVKTVQGDNGELRSLLEAERVEKGELVQLAEEMMAMQQQSFIATTQEREQREQREQRERERERAPAPTPSAARATPNKRHSVIGTPSRRQTVAPVPAPAELAAPRSAKRISGLKAPSSIARSGIRPPGHERKFSSGGPVGIPRPGSGSGSRSGIMSSIEKMGAYRGRGE